MVTTVITNDLYLEKRHFLGEHHYINSIKFSSIFKNLPSNMNKINFPCNNKYRLRQ